MTSLPHTYGSPSYWVVINSSGTSIAPDVGFNGNTTSDASATTHLFGKGTIESGELYLVSTGEITNYRQGWDNANAGDDSAAVKLEPSQNP